MDQAQKQPKGLFVFFLTEMWERYGFYVLQTILIFFLIQKFKITDTDGYSILGSFTALAYINPIIGGYLADRLIGYRAAVLLGALILCIGYFYIVLSDTLSHVYLALGIITMGTGLLKPNISSMVGTLYHEGDKRRESGFTLFYVGINLGIIAGTLFPGYIQRYFDWAPTFASAGFGLIIAFLIFFFGTKICRLKDPRGIVPDPASWLKVGLVLGVTIFFNRFVVAHQHFALYMFFLIVVLSAAVVIYEAFREQGVARKKLLAYLVLVCISALFWAMYFQIFFSINVFISRVVDRNLFGTVIPPGVFAGIEAFGVILFGPILSYVWLKIKNTRFDMSIPMKFSFSMLLTAVSFGLLLLGSKLTNQIGLVSPWWIVVVYLLISIAELSLSPIGLSMVTELVPSHLVGLMMGIFFVSLGIGGKLSGLFANAAAISSDVTDIRAMDVIYQHAFFKYFIVALVASLVSLALKPVIKNWIHSR